MSAFLTAMGSGISAKKILEYIMRQSPQLAPKITTALASGLSAERVLKFFSKDKNFENLKSSMEQQYSTENNANPLVQAENIRTKNLAPDMASGLQRAAGPVLGTAAALGTSYALSRALPPILQAGKSILSPQTTQEKNQTQTPIIPQTQAPPSNATNIPPSPTTPQAKGISNIASESLKKHGLLKHVEEIAKTNNDPNIITGVLYSKFPKEMQAFQKDVGKNMEDAIADFLKGFPSFVETKQPEQKTQNKQVADLDTMEKALIKDKTINQEGSSKTEKGSLVAFPQGVGEVKEIRNGKALVDVNGKIHKVNEEDLEVEPAEIAQLDLKGPVEEYLKRIPESQKSSVIDVTLYDPEKNELQVRFPSGDQWIYSPVPEEIFDKINSMTGIPVTSGESKLRGTIWEKGEATSAGADFFKLIKKLVREGKIKERKLKTGIDLFKGFTSVKKRK